MKTEWLTPQTAIGSTLPCGAKVVDAFSSRGGDIAVTFDREPKGGKWGRGFYNYNSCGRHWRGDLPDLTPAAKPAGVFVTREMLAEVYGGADRMGLNALADALGIPPDPPKKAPWEAAYEAWWAAQEPGAPDSDDVWKAAVEWCLYELRHDVPTHFAYLYRRRIMGDEA